jgi:transcription elongation factor Elf1
MLTTGMDNCARPGMACSECNDLLVAPTSSAYVSSHEVRHVWSCENCGHEIEMAVNLRFDRTSGQSTVSPSRISAPNGGDA